MHCSSFLGLVLPRPEQSRGEVLVECFEVWLRPEPRVSVIPVIDAPKPGLTPVRPPSDGYLGVCYFDFFVRTCASLVFFKFVADTSHNGAAYSATQTFVEFMRTAFWTRGRHRHLGGHVLVVRRITMLQGLPPM